MTLLLDPLSQTELILGSTQKPWLISGVLVALDAGSIDELKLN